mmetsp:Transcript_20060/g.80364  ORF Transcript_20060/g.80364 Transcript_20060/m.80364 type:complete len:88 (-) Transcript_20060:1600-1863(-)
MQWVQVHIRSGARPDQGGPKMPGGFVCGRRWEEGVRSFSSEPFFDLETSIDEDIRPPSGRWISSAKSHYHPENGLEYDGLRNLKICP